MKLALVPLFNRTAVRIRLTDLFINLLVSPISQVSIINDSLERVISARLGVFGFDGFSSSCGRIIMGLNITTQKCH